jgi:energy-coupling factor transporter ATP-binding protein EcfA2
MLTRLHVRNFKSLRDLEVRFGQLTVLVGPNGCGKSSVLQAIEALRNLILAQSHAPAPFPAELVSRPYGTTEAAESVRMRMELAPPPREVVVEADLVPHVRWGTIEPQRSSLVCRSGSDELTKDWAHSDVPEWVRACFQPIGLYRLDARVMEQPSYSEESNPLLGASGENLAAVLDALQGTRREEFEAIEHELCSFITGLRHVRLHRKKTSVVRTVPLGSEWRQIQDEVIGHQVVLDFDFARSVAADQVSEGTLLLLGLLTVIGVGADRPMTVMLDDLDRALHPRAQRKLVEHLHQLLAERRGLQIIATSHSPYLVEHLAYEEVLAMTQAPDDGRSVIAPLAEHPDAARWREEMSAGEFWSTVGEHWLLEGRSPS